MNVKYTYDEETEDNIKRFKLYLAQYEEILSFELNKRGYKDQEYQRAYLEDAGRKTILDSLNKIYSLSIPESISFIGVPDDY